MMTDPIADMLTRIRNAAMAKQSSVTVPYSKMKAQIAKLLQEQNFIQFCNVSGEKTKKVLVLLLKYTKEGKSVIRVMQRVSKPGQRIFRSYQDLPPVRNGFGMSVLTTPKGILSDAQARKNKVGGEILLTIW